MQLTNIWTLAKRHLICDIENFPNEIVGYLKFCIFDTAIWILINPGKYSYHYNDWSFGQIPKQFNLQFMWKKFFRKLNECKQAVNNISNSFDKAANLIELYSTLSCKKPGILWYVFFFGTQQIYISYCIFCFIFECKYPIMSFILYLKKIIITRSVFVIVVIYTGKVWFKIEVINNCFFFNF